MFSALKGRVRQLEMGVEEINKTFLSFTDDQMKRGMLESHPDLAQNLHRTIERCITLTNRAISVAEDKVDSVAIADADAYGSERGANTNAPADTAGQNADGAIATPGAADSQSSGTLLFLQQTVQRSDTQTTQEPTRLPVSETPAEAAQIPKTTLSANNLSLNIYKPKTATFALRLYNACFEQGYEFLTDPSSQLEELLYRFRLPLKLLPPYSLTAHFEDFLRHGNHSTIKERHIPFISIGGAGAHFRHEHRSYILGETLSIVRVEAEQVDSDMRGDWFDCFDVEGYLRGNNIKPVRGRLNVNPRASVPQSLTDSGDALRYHRSGQGSCAKPKRQTFVDESILIERTLALSE